MPHQTASRADPASILSAAAYLTFAADLSYKANSGTGTFQEKNGRFADCGRLLDLEDLVSEPSAAGEAQHLESSLATFPGMPDEESFVGEQGNNAG